MNIPGFLAVKNSVSVAKWRWRWHLQGGSKFWVAHSLLDLRNDEDRRRYRAIEVKRRHTPFGGLVVNIAAWRFERVRRQATCRTASA